MKQIALLKYQIMFDPSEAWSNGYQFENQLADFFAAYGFEAQIIEARGGTGERVIWLQRMNTATPIENTKSKPAMSQIKRVQGKLPPKDYKKFSQKIVHEHMQSPDKLEFSRGYGRLRQKVRMP